MSKTLEQLRTQWASPCPSMTAIREHYFPHIGTDRRFRELIQKGEINLSLRKLHNSAKAQYVIYLYDLADYLDNQAAKRTA
ncbi:pyocin activator PrtN family protein [Pseudomonas sp. 148P]|uniref:Pyocin activator PrtN family protein n=1 Tax=Pseudomonas ulcerans TaxID=3115852 RepID=A0ABU7HWB9_9PSED|nr:MULTISPECIES: pyocin activator PrtN family protein [unclassified Pseudomonas]MEE1922881.1 pyocin activator PrtN family protein [Pseudomonas sp. 147P]MEE1935731.1 pyocin activator PrtN family protein [Pseudomonas sp. 148P]